MIPQHVGIILDGNRRYAKELMKKPWKGHREGVRKARDVLRWADDVGIEHLTAYVLSIENYESRPEKELDMILKYFREELDEVLSGDHPIHETETRVRFVGRLEILPDDLTDRMERIEEETSDYTEHTLNVCVAYGGQQEIVDACREIAEQVSGGQISPEEINPEVFSYYLYLNGGTPYPDLILRTGGEKRLSNFLLWQSAYSELFFVDERWPELSRETFMDVLSQFDERDRRYGQ